MIQGRTKVSLSLRETEPIQTPLNMLENFWERKIHTLVVLFYTGAKVSMQLSPVEEGEFLDSANEIKDITVGKRK